jgi:hypothetical protein
MSVLLGVVLRMVPDAAATAPNDPSVCIGHEWLGAEG